jgi:hypothetical protein
MLIFPIGPSPSLIEQSVSRSKTKKSLVSEASDQSKTDALKNYEENLDLLLAFLNRFYPKDAQRSIKVLHNAVEPLKDNPERLKDNPKNVTSLTRAANKLRSTVQEYFAAFNLAQAWMCVMLVTFIETYLEDGLIGLSAINPKLMKNAPPIYYQTILETESLDELHQEVRRQWARQMVEGGPPKFVRRLKDMGARDYDEKGIFRIEHLWDTRNLIVHSRGVADVAYVKKYKYKSLQAGTRLTVNLGWWLPAVKGFVECTDRFFLNYGSGVSKDPT